MPTSINSVMATGSLLLLGCFGAGLPDNFLQLPLEAQVKAYENNFRKGGGRLIKANDEISWHGRPAAFILAEYLSGKRNGIPAADALELIGYIQLRGCALKGTPVELAVQKEVASAPLDSLEYQVGSYTLRVIQQDIVRPQAETKPGGPCEAELELRHSPKSPQPSGTGK